MAKHNYIKLDASKFIVLTPKGEKVAENLYARHTHLARFFMQTLNLDEKLAGEYACKMEHFINEETYKAVRKFINK